MKIFPKNQYKYYYHPDTGVFVGSTFNVKESQWDHLPYIQREQFRYCDYRVDVETGKLIHDPIPTQQR